MGDEAHDHAYDSSINQPNEREDERRDEGIEQGEQTQKEAEENPDHGSKSRSLERSPSIPHPPGHLLYQPQALSHDGDTLHRESFIREIIDGPLGLGVRAVRGYDT